MSNTFTTPPTIPDTGDLIAGRQIKTTSLQRMGDLSNYLHAHGSTSNALSQAFDANTCVTQSASFVDLCRWRVPIPSNDHTTIDFHIIAKITTTGTGTVKFTLTDSNSVNQGNSSISVTSTSFAALTVSHSFSASTTADYVEIVMSGKVATAATYDLEIQCVAARFIALTSPLSAGETAQGTDKLTPFGVDRLTANNALSSRAGVQFRTNIETLRERKRSLLTWSGIENPSSVFSGRGRGPKALGVGDVKFFQNQSALFAGGGNLSLNIYVQGFSGSPRFAFMGLIFNITANGWLQYDLTPDLDRITLESNAFGLNLYKVGPTFYNASDSAIDTIQRKAVINNSVRITAVSVWSK